MEFSYSKTFLRSALAKDPYALGDLGPEDVLRIESEFPDLFAPSTLNEIAEEPSAPIKKNVKPFVPRVARLSKVQGKSITVQNPVQQQQQPSTMAQRKQQQTVQGKATMNIAASSTNSQVNKKGDNRETGQQQLISVDQLKRVLSDMLHPQQPVPIYSSRPSTPKLNAFSSPKKPSKSATTAHLQQQIRSALHGKIGSQNYAKCFLPSPQAKPRSLRGDGETPLHHLGKALQTVNENISRLGGKKHPQKQLKMELPKSKSVPGFIRDSSIHKIPRRPSALSKGMDSPGSKKSVKFSNPDADKKFTEHHEEKRDKEKQSLAAEECVDVDHISKIPLELETVKASPNQMHIKGQGKAEESESSEETTEDSKAKLSDTFVSYQQLILTRNLATKYEKFGLLKKMQPNSASPVRVVVNRDDRPKSGKQAPKGVVVYHDRPKSCKESRNKEDPTHDATSLPIPSNRKASSEVLERIAKELVYVEVMKHLQDLQSKEQMEKQERIQDQSNPFDHHENDGITPTKSSQEDVHSNSKISKTSPIKKTLATIQDIPSNEQMDNLEKQEPIKFERTYAEHENDGTTSSQDDIRSKISKTTPEKKLETSHKSLSDIQEQNELDLLSAPSLSSMESPPRNKSHSTTGSYGDDFEPPTPDTPRSQSSRPAYPQTKDLSPAAANKNDVTDCSEISDSIFSEVTTSKTSNRRRVNDASASPASFKANTPLVTPQLSTSKSSSPSPNKNNSGISNPKCNKRIQTQPTNNKSTTTSPKQASPRTPKDVDISYESPDESQTFSVSYSNYSKSFVEVSDGEFLGDKYKSPGQLEKSYFSPGDLLLSREGEDKGFELLITTSSSSNNSSSSKSPIRKSHPVKGIEPRETSEGEFLKPWRNEDLSVSKE